MNRTETVKCVRCGREFHAAEWVDAQVKANQHYAEFHEVTSPRCGKVGHVGHWANECPGRSAS